MSTMEMGEFKNDGVLCIVKSCNDLKMDREFIMKHTIPQLINYEINKPLLRIVPHLRWMDLAIIPRLYYKDETDLTDVILTMEGLEKHGLDFKELMLTALHNMEGNVGTFKLILMDDLYEENEETHMYIITNENGKYGAIALCFPSLYEEIADAYQSDVIIFPSSIHETIAMPYELASDKNYDDVVKDVNKECVAMDEVLSDHVYFYRRRDKKIVMNLNDN